MNISNRQIRAARALAGWTQAELAKAARVNVMTIKNAETTGHVSERATLERIKGALEAAGIRFTDRGVEATDAAVYEIAGDGWWVRVLDDVYATLAGRSGAELLMLFSDDSVSPPEVNARLREIRAAGIGLRQLVREGNRYLLGPVSDYRWVPEAYFKNRVTLVYGEKTVLCAEDNTKAVIVKDAGLAETWRNLFEMLWKGVLLSKPDRSTAHDEDRF